MGDSNKFPPLTVSEKGGKLDVIAGRACGANPSPSTKNSFK